jgi:PAS domain S-box-containing protein
VRDRVDNPSDVSDPPRPTGSPRRSGGLRDLLLILAAVGALFVVGVVLGVFDALQQSTVRWHYLDDALAAALLLIAGIAIFAVLNWRQAERAESLRHETEKRFRTIVERVPAVAYVWDGADSPGEAAAGYISPQIEQLLGYTAEEWIARPHAWSERVHSDDLKRVLAHWDEAVDAGRTFAEEYRIRRADGRWVWIRDEANPIGTGPRGRAIYQGVMVDVTERREAEERYRSLVEQLPVAVYTDAVDDVSTALYISPQYELLTGYSPEERLHNPDLWVRMLHPDDRDRVIAESNRTNESGDPFDTEYRIVAADGRIVWLHDHAVLVEGPAGRRIWQGVLTDVTERTLAQDALVRRDRVLQATAFAAERFLTSPSWSDVIDDVLEHLGVAGGASRAYVYAYEPGPTGEATVSEQHVWYAPGAEAARPRSLATRFPLRAGGFGRWEDVLSTGGVIHGLVREFPEDERGVLERGPLPVRALVCVPIFVEDEWWGYVGFDRSEEERTWQDAEVEAVTVTANTLGAAIGREWAAHRLSEARERYRQLVEKMPAITYVDEYRGDLGHAWPTTYISPQVETILGYTVDDWIRDPETWVTLVHPDDRGRAREADRRHYSTGEPLDVELRVRTADGGYRWLRDQAVMVRDEEGRPRWSQGILLDVTERKEAELALDDAEKRYRTLIETIPAVTYVDAVDESSTTIYVSPQVESILGYTPERWRADTELWSRNAHPDDVERVSEQIQRHNRDGEPYDVEYRFRHRDGRWLWVRDQAVVIRDDDGQPLFSQGVIYDITEHKLAEDQLRDAEERFRAIVEHVPAAIYLDRADTSLETVYVSPQIADITGITPQEWTDNPRARLDAIVPEDRDRVLGGYLTAVEARVPWLEEYRLRRRDGRTIWIRDETTLLHDETGSATFVQGVIFDITERKLAEETLRASEQREREAAERLRALDDMKNTFLAAVSHELRSPLTSILGLSLTLERAPDIDGDDREELLRRLAANARKLDRLLKDLLDIDRLNRGIVEPAYRVTDVGALARGAVESLDALAGRHVSTETESIILAVDPAKVERIVENLLMNAARHTARDRHIWLRVSPSENGVLIVVEDDGPGVAPQMRTAIFEPFRQGPTVSPHTPGTGIGLSLVARFAELHGGRAWVEDRDGGGASFRVLLPAGPGFTLRQPAAAGDEERRAARPRAGTG